MTNNPETKAIQLAHANANLTLWCVHVLGEDGVYATTSYEAAVDQAAKANAILFNHIRRKTDVLCFAYAAPWPHSKESHAQDLKKHHREWREEQIKAATGPYPRFCDLCGNPVTPDNLAGWDDDGHLYCTCHGPLITPEMVND
ncbi:MAG: hypothetical protein Q4G24_10180 [Paracoccus sp. (in: a-proteobacteria)]|uniref:hypothetical protein n=1 Tax=Paracoccus sp. TaxID=267 RepID=UPI0026E028CA|nr:hypothetical protein [Paracoccus sp. (in: a-proteobacteria)]MDO5621825.1 hypothetical protein [Paracoccus sp. (in: a-proteobacteria)]